MANKTKAKAFIEKWKNRGDEKQDTSRFWLELLQEVYGDTEVYNPEHLSFEVPTGKNNKKGKEFKDVVINRRSNNTTLIEQKSFDIDLDKPTKQSDGSFLTPFEQAIKYDNNSSVDDKANWIITCNFHEIRIHDMSKEGVERYKFQVIKLEDLPSKIEWLNFLLPNYSEEKPSFNEEVDVSFDAGKLVGKMYDALLKRYAEPETEHTKKELNKLCVRLVFCLYADDAGLFDKNDTSKFENYIRNTETKYVRQALIDLFKVLDQKENERDKYLDDTLKSFPYVNGGLFQGNVEIPNFDDDLKKLLVEDESASFDWSVVSPTIFGAVFESTLNTETRRNGGMHYTSIENIHKVIDNLFLNNLRSELNNALSINVASKKENALREFQNKISSLTFLDPACGSGNFLTETYLSLRRLENEVIRQLQGINVALNFENASVIKVSIQQFFGIEINDFAVSVAKTALWIAESQMFKETQTILSANREYFPLQTFNNIVEGNALRIIWNDVIDNSKLNYIMGNPPFIGYTYQSKEQKEDLRCLKFLDSKNVDYVCGWYYKACEYAQNTNINIAFVSTNSITQGEQVFSIWKPLFDNYHIIFNFAHKTFIWNSEALDKAHVYCTIIGFDFKDKKGEQKYIYENNIAKKANNINAYLMDAPNIFIGRRAKPITGMPEMVMGNKPTDGGNLFLNEEEKKDLILKYPKIEPYIRQFVSSDEFINNKIRYCFWLKECPPDIMKNCPTLQDRLNRVRSLRLASTKEATRKKAKTPMLFDEIRECKEDYLIIPKVSSERREYIPIGFANKNIIGGDGVRCLDGATTYIFGVLTSAVHMAWMRAVCGRLKSDYSYSNTVVYNNFVWPTPTNEQIAMIEQTAQGILDARALYPDSSLASLYDPTLMPIELRKAHEENDKAVMQAYGFKKEMSESEIVAKLFGLYQKTTLKNAE